MTNGIKTILLPANTEQRCGICDKKADLFMAFYRDSRTSLTVDNSGQFLCVRHAADFVEANK